MKYFILILWLFLIVPLYAQTKVSGLVTDQDGLPISFANIIFPGSIEGTITNDDGSFYLESDKTYTLIEISFIGFTTKRL
jgi:hypothetical protein